jgi:hypothetical protein
VISKRQAGLIERYRRWEETVRTREHVVRALSRLGFSPPKLEAALENALMRLLLDLDGKPPSDLLRQLKLEHVLEGFACIGVTDRRPALMAFDILESLPVATNPSHLTVEETDEALTIGAFSLEKNPPVSRLLDYAKSRMPDREAREHVVISALRYASIFARTRHIGPPQGVYDLFHDWGVRNEGFASPFNARLLGKLDSGFFSAFPLEDRPFGSRGSFFRAEHAQFDGAWCVDPPFLTETMSRTDAILDSWREAGFTPGVILIVPSSYQVETPVDETVELQASVHHYQGLDGAHHPLPTDVSIHRIGHIPGWDAAAIVDGYLADAATDVA